METNRPEISVILPVYNVGKYLKKCLDSIVNQTFKNIEIICVNDGSNDNSLEILNEYLFKDNRFVVISQENQGQGIARNKGVEIAKGKYLQFIDPDDWIENDALEKLYSFAQKNNSKVVKFNYCDYNEYSGKFKKNDFSSQIKKTFNYNLTKKPYYNWKIFQNGCLSELDLHVWSHFFLTSFIKSNNICFAPNKHGEDHLFVNGAFLLTDKIDFLDETLYYYRTRVDSSINIKSDDNFCIFDNIELLKQFLIEHLLYEDLEDEMKNYAKHIIGWHYNSIPENSIKKYEDLSLKYFNSKEEFEKFIKEEETAKTFIENIFSLKSKRIGAIKYKALTILGFTVLIKPRKQKTTH